MHRIALTSALTLTAACGMGTLDTRATVPTGSYAMLMAIDPARSDAGCRTRATLTVAIIASGDDTKITLVGGGTAVGDVSDDGKRLGFEMVVNDKDVDGFLTWGADADKPTGELQIGDCLYTLTTR